MKTNMLAMSLLLSLGLSVATAGQVDPRFDGKWIGVETLEYSNFGFRHNIYLIRGTTVIGIADSAKIFGVLSGFAPGRYEISPESSGKTLIFQAPNQGRQRCRLVLSSDGNTLKEDGIAILNSRSHHAQSAQVWATFRRQAK